MASFATFGEAWGMISSTTPPLATLLLEGMLLKKSPNSNLWVPAIIGQFSKHLLGLESIEAEISFWNILDIRHLISYYMEDCVVQLLEFLSSCVWKEYQSSSSVKRKTSSERLMDFLRDLERPGQEKERAKLRMIAVKLQDIVLEILEQVSTVKIKLSAKVIQQAFGHTKFDSVDRRQLEQLIFGCQAHVQQVKQILRQEAGLGLLFGIDAVDVCRKLFEKVHQTEGDLDEVEWDDRIFEDEEQYTNSKKSQGIRE